MNILTIIIVFAIIGSVVALVLGDETSFKKKVAGGASMGVLTFFGLLIKVVLPIIITVSLFKACF